MCRQGREFGVAQCRAMMRRVDGGQRLPASDQHGASAAPLTVARTCSSVAQALAYAATRTPIHIRKPSEHKCG
jgi:hypothetical protein